MAIERFDDPHDGVEVEQITWDGVEFNIKPGFAVVKEADLAALETRNEKLEQAMLEAAKLWAVWMNNRRLTPTLIDYLDGFGNFLSPLQALKEE